MRALGRFVDASDADLAVGAIEGEIDASNVHDLGRRLRGLLTNHSDALVVDLVETTYIDSAGINLLFELASELHQRQQRTFLVVADASPIARMVGITGLGEAVPVHPTRAEALREASAPAR